MPDPTRHQPDRDPEREAIVAYRQAKNKVCDAAAAWHAWNEPRRDRMTRQELALYDSVTELLAAGRAMVQADPEDGGS